MRSLSKTLAAAAFGGTLGLVGLASAPALAQSHFHDMGGWHGTTARSGTWRDRDDRMGFRDRDDRFRFRDRDDFRFHRPFVRDRFAFGVGFYGGWPYYDYPYYGGYYAPYGYGYGYDYGYCDPYSDYYDPYYCGGY
jgi:hypothetical protein